MSCRSPIDIIPMDFIPFESSSESQRLCERRSINKITLEDIRLLLTDGTETETIPDNDPTIGTFSRTVSCDQGETGSCSVEINPDSSESFVDVPDKRSKPICKIPTPTSRNHVENQRSSLSSSCRHAEDGSSLSSIVTSTSRSIEFARKYDVRLQSFIQSMRRSESSRRYVRRVKMKIMNFFMDKPTEKTGLSYAVIKASRRRSRKSSKISHSGQNSHKRGYNLWQSRDRCHSVESFKAKYFPDA